MAWGPDLSVQVLLTFMCDIGSTGDNGLPGMYVLVDRLDILGRKSCRPIIGLPFFRARAGWFGVLPFPAYSPRGRRLTIGLVDSVSHRGILIGPAGALLSSVLRDNIEPLGHVEERRDMRMKRSIVGDDLLIYGCYEDGRVGCLKRSLLVAEFWSLLSWSYCSLGCHQIGK